MGKFAIFSTELGPMLDVTDEYDSLVHCFIFGTDPIGKGNYDPHVGTTKRGSIIATLGGVIVQDFGDQIQDQRITFTDDSALTLADVTALQTIYSLASTELYFTDGYDCWKVQFALPNGFRYKRNLITSYHGVARFDYEINLVVKDHENV